MKTPEIQIGKYKLNMLEILHDKLSLLQCRHCYCGKLFAASPAPITCKVSLYRDITYELGNMELHLYHQPALQCL